ncbi:hypothetical protein S83_005396 [Arachis hypogaea]
MYGRCYLREKIGTRAAHTLDTTSDSDAPPSLTPPSPLPPGIESVPLSSSLDGGVEADSESALHRRDPLFDTSLICSLLVAACFLGSTTNDSMNAAHVQRFISISCPMKTCPCWSTFPSPSVECCHVLP